MNDYTMYGGSICVTDLMDALKRGHSAFSKSPKNGKVYCNIVEFVREAPDDYGQHAAIQMSSTKEKRDEEKQAYGKLNYLGNLKKLEANAPVTERATSNIASEGWDRNVPVRATPDNYPPPSAYQNQGAATTYNDIPPTADDSDLPF